MPRPAPLLLAAAFLVAVATPMHAQTYDVVLRGGRVMDPESGLDAVRDVGIRGGTIAAISESCGFHVTTAVTSSDAKAATMSASDVLTTVRSFSDSPTVSRARASR